MEKFTYPKICYSNDNKIFISFYYDGIRYRLSNGKRIGLKLYPNKFKIEEREFYAKKLAVEVYDALKSNKPFDKYRSEKLIGGNLSDIQYIERAFNLKKRLD